MCMFDAADAKMESEVKKVKWSEVNETELE